MPQLCWPNGRLDAEPRRTDNYGPRDPIWTSGGRTRPYHVGTDWAGIGRICSIGNGVVISTEYIGWAGWQVLIDLGVIDGERTWVRYCHLASRSHLSRGDHVGIGHLVGYEGESGMVAGVHLHMEIYRGRVDRGDGSGPAATVDPRAFISAHLKTAPAVPEELGEDMSTTGVYARLDNSGNDSEWMRVNEEFGKDLNAGEKRTEATENGVIVTRPGYQVTTDKLVGQAWGRLHARFYKNVPSRFPRDQYISIQAEAERFAIAVRA